MLLFWKMLINYEQLQGKNRRVLGVGFFFGYWGLFGLVFGVGFFWLLVGLEESMSFLDKVCSAGVFN